MSKKMLCVVFVTTGLVAVGGLAFADEPYLPKAQKTFDRLDVNKDGKLSLRIYPCRREEIMSMT